MLGDVYIGGRVAQVFRRWVGKMMMNPGLHQNLCQLTRLQLIHALVILLHQQPRTFALAFLGNKRAAQQATGSVEQEVTCVD